MNFSPKSAVRATVGCAVLLSALWISGCSKPSMVGKWAMSGGQMPQGMNVVVDFASDNKFKMAISGAVGGVNLKISGDGTYKMDGENFEMTTTSSKVEEPAALRQMIEGQLKSSIGKTEKGKIKIEGDTATFTAQQTITFTKVKS